MLRSASRPLMASVVRMSASTVRPAAFQGMRSISVSSFQWAPKFAKSHEWADLKDGVATIGISDHAQAALGDIVFAELPTVGDTMEVGKTIAAVESVKAAADVYSPVAGTVVEVNSSLADTPDTINSSPMADGWLAKVKVSNPADMDKLMDEAKYAKFLEESTDGH